MHTLRRRSSLILLLLIPAAVVLTLSVPVWAESNAAIQASAHVEAPIGLIDAEIEFEGRNYDSLPGSHLYWLYFPRHEGVLLQLTRTNATVAFDSLSSRNTVARFLPDILREYTSAALVDLGAVSGDGIDVADVTLTVIFTDN